MSKPGLLAVSFYKPSDGTTYQIDGSNVAPDSQGYKKTALKFNAVKGNERVKTYEHSFVIRHNDSTFHSNFTGDTDVDNRSWRIVWAEFEKFGLWYETSRVIVEEEKVEIDPESDDVFPYTLTVRVVSNNASIGRGTNLLYAYAKANGRASAWQDSDANNIADGFAFSTAPDSSAFASGEQSATFSSGTNIRFVVASESTGIVFPIAGITLTGFADFVETHDNTDESITARYRDNSGSSLSSASETVSAPGVQGVTRLSPASTYYISFEFFTLTSVSGSDAIILKDPGIRLNGSEVYVDY